jgi:hypothetical protein
MKSEQAPTTSPKRCQVYFSIKTNKPDTFSDGPDAEVRKMYQVYLGAEKIA